MSIKSIRPIAPIASQMPSKSVAPIGATAPLKSISTGMRPIVTPEKGLPQIGPDKPKDTARDATYKSKRDDKLPYAFQSLSKFMPTSIINTSQKTFNSAYVNGFSNYNDFFGTLLKDFGPGQLKTYQTPSGSKDMYEYQYTNYLKYGNVNGPAQINVGNTEADTVSD
jgi:hypothetical protein